MVRFKSMYIYLKCNGDSEGGQEKKNLVTSFIHIWFRFEFKIVNNCRKEFFNLTDVTRFL